MSLLILVAYETKYSKELYIVSDSNGYLIGHENKKLSLEEAIDIIIIYNERIGDFWSRSHGWAPSSAADLLAKSRLDWLLYKAVLGQELLYSPVIPENARFIKRETIAQ